MRFKQFLFLLFARFLLFSESRSLFFQTLLVLTRILVKLLFLLLLFLHIVRQTSFAQHLTHHFSNHAITELYNFGICILFHFALIIDGNDFVSCFYTTEFLSFLFFIFIFAFLAPFFLFFAFFLFYLNFLLFFFLLRFST